MTEQMKVYTLRDYTGCESTHLAVSYRSAIQAHLVHYGLLYLKGEIEIVNIKELRDIKDRSTICWDLSCTLAGTSDG